MWMMPTNQNQKEDQLDPNELILLLTGLSAATAFFLASHAPSQLVAPILSQLLWWSALGSAIVAAVQRQPFIHNHLTYWDQAIFLFLFSLVANNFVDPDAVNAVLETATVEPIPNLQSPRIR